MVRKAEEWVSTTQRHEDTLEGITCETWVVRELPAKPTERQSAGSHSHHQPAAAAAPPNYRSLAQAFTGAPGTSTDPSFADARAAAMFSSLQAARSSWQGVEAELEGECFSGIMELGQRAHEVNMAKARAGEATLIPTLLLSCNGLAAGDQDATYKRLMQHLQQQNAYAALLQPSQFQHGAGATISHIMGQLSSGATADDMHGLYQWYQDEIGPPAGPSGSAGPRQPQPPPARAPAAAPAPAPKGKRNLRERKPPALLPGQLLISDQFSAKRQANARRQLVVVVCGADQVPPLALQDLTAALLQDYIRFPVTLVLGLSRPASLFLATLPLACCARLAPSLRDLPPQSTRLEALVRGVLCGTPPPLALLSERPLLAVLQHYEHQAGSAAGVMQALELAHTLHHAAQPLACLAHAAFTETAVIPTTGATGSGAKECIELMDSSSEDEEEGGAAQGATTPARVRPPARAASGGGDAVTPGLLQKLDDFGVHSQVKGAAPAAARVGAGSSLERAVAGLPAGVVVQMAEELRPAADRGAGALVPGARGDGAVQVKLVAGAQARAKRSGAAKQDVGAAAAGSLSVDGQAGGKAGGKAAQSASQRGASVAAEVVEAAGVCVEALRGAVDVFARWRLGVLVAVATARVTGAAQARPEYRLPALYCAAASKAFNKAMGRGRLSACQHLLSELCGSGTLSVSGLSDPLSLDNLLDDILQAVQQSQQWRPLADVAELESDLTRLRAGEDPLQPPASEGQGAGAEGGTPQPQRTAGRLDEAGGPSPASLLRHGLAAATLDGSPAPPAPPAGTHASTHASKLPKSGGLQATLEAVGGDVEGTAASTQAGPSAPKAGSQDARVSAVPGRFTGSKTNNAARKQQLLQLIQAESQVTLAQATATSREGEGAGTGAPEEVTPAGQAAAWIKATLQRLLQHCPFDMPGAAAFTFHDAHALEEMCLVPQPRAALHDALLHPSRYLGSHCIDDPTPLSTDIEVAYQRLAGRDSVSITAWFQEFCEVQDMEVGDYSQQDNNTQAPKQARETKKAAAPVPARGAKGKRKQAEESVVPESRGIGAGRTEGQMEQAVLTWAARFSQAAGELQYMGVVRPSKRKKDKSMQVMFQPCDMAAFV